MNNNFNTREIQRSILFQNLSVSMGFSSLIETKKLIKKNKKQLASELGKNNVSNN